MKINNTYRFLAGNKHSGNVFYYEDNGIGYTYVLIKAKSFRQAIQRLNNLKNFRDGTYYYAYTIPGSTTVPSK